MRERRFANLFLLITLALVITRAGGLGAGIFESVRSGDIKRVKELLKNDPKLATTRSEDGSTPLHLAALEGHSAIAQLLIDSRAEVNARGPRNETPLHLAMYDGHRELAELLLDHKADLNAQNSSGETPLHIAARKGHRELVEL